MARFNLNPDLKSYTRYFGRGLLILAAVLVVAGLVLGTFFYGDRQRQSNQTTDQIAGQATNEAGQVQVENPPATSTAPEAAQPSPAAPSTSGTIPSGGPTQVPVTGPEDFLLPACIGLAVLVYQHRRSRQRLAMARENV